MSTRFININKIIQAIKCKYIKLKEKKQKIQKNNSIKKY